MAQSKKFKKRYGKNLENLLRGQPVSQERMRGFME
jgi:hypothetical protein